MEEKNLVNYIFTKEEFLQKLGLSGEIDIVTSSGDDILVRIEKDGKA